MTDIQPHQFEPEEPLQDDSDCFEESGIIEESARKPGNTNWCLCELCVCLAQVTSQHLNFLLPAFKSDIHNGGPPVIWIISLYLRYQVWFVIIIVKFLFIVISITYLNNII